jgi:hypothetical protein
MVLKVLLQDLGLLSEACRPIQEGSKIVAPAYIVAKIEKKLFRPRRMKLFRLVLSKEVEETEPHLEEIHRRKGLLLFQGPCVRKNPGLSDRRPSNHNPITQT